MTDPLWRICALFQRARTRVLVVSAFLGEEPLDRLLQAVPDGVETRGVYARWSHEDVASRATDWRAWDVAKRHDVTLYECSRLHAKMYIADNRALVGSANTTRGGLGLRENGNLEVLVEVDAREPSVSEVLAEVMKSSIEARPFGADAVATGTAKEGEIMPGVWLPEIGPEFLEDAIRGKVPHCAKTRETMDALQLLATDDVAAIRAAVASTCSFRVVSHAFQGRLLPMNMDEIVQLLATQVDPRMREVPRDQISLLVRWLGYFGSNTHFRTGPDGESLALHPGTRLTSIKVRSTDL